MQVRGIDVNALPKEGQSKDEVGIYGEASLPFVQNTKVDLELPLPSRHVVSRLLISSMIAASSLTIFTMARDVS
jgi:hypothetical protein